MAIITTPGAGVSPYEPTTAAPTILRAGADGTTTLANIVATVATVDVNGPATTPTDPNVSIYVTGQAALNSLTTTSQPGVFEGANVNIVLEEQTFSTTNQVTSTTNYPSGNVGEIQFNSGSNSFASDAYLTYTNGNVITPGIRTNGYFYANGAPFVGGGNAAIGNFVFTGDTMSISDDANISLTIQGNSLGNNLNQIIINPTSVDLYAFNNSPYSYAELYLDNGNTEAPIAQIIVDGNSTPQQTWTFDSTGNLTLPGNTIAINYANGNRITGNVTFRNEIVIGTGTSNLISGLYLAPSSSSADANMYLRVRGNINDEPTHIHFDTGNNQYYNQFIGDDNKYIQLANTGNIVINSNDNVGNSAQWTFAADGNITLPYNAVIKDTVYHAVAFGKDAGLTSQGQESVAIGHYAGRTSQGNGGVAIGVLAGNSSQGQEAVAVGIGAGRTNQGVNSVAIGSDAGRTDQGNNSIIINATGSALNQTTANTFTVAPVRNDVANTAEIVFYNATSKEITYGNVISVAGNITGNYFIGDGSQLTGINNSFAGEMHVSKDGNDSTGTGNILQPYLTVTHALTQVAGGRNTIVIHPGEYTENPTITSTNTQLITYDTTGASTIVVGTVTIANVDSRIAGLRMANLIIAGNSQVYISGSTVTEQFTKSSSGYVEVDDCELQVSGNVLISGSGTITIIGNKINNLVVNNAGAAVLVKGATDCLMPQVTAGSLNIVDSVIRASSNTANAVTASAGTVVTLMNNQIVTPAADNVARVSIAGFHSIISLVYDKANSTLSNSLNSVVYFQTANVDSLVSSGNVTGGNILTAGLISATGNITGNCFIGNGSQLTSVAVPSQTILPTVQTITVSDTSGVGNAGGGGSAFANVTVSNVTPVTEYGVIITSGTSSQKYATGALGSIPGTVKLSFTTGLNSTPFTVFAYVTSNAGTFYSNSATGTSGICLLAGTQIALSDGSHKAIEDITYTDKLLSWDFDRGCYVETTALWIKRSETGSQYNLLTFNDGTTLRTFDQHRIFNKQAGAFTYPMTDATPVGTITVNEHGQEITLTNKQVIQDTIDYYNVITDHHMNLFSDSVLTSCRFNNIYPVIDMKFVKDSRTPRTRAEFANIPDRFFHGLRLAEQTVDVETVEWYVDRLVATEASTQVELTF